MAKYVYACVNEIRKINGNESGEMGVKSKRNEKKKATPHGTSFDK
jgi:hypothetical protein